MSVIIVNRYESEEELVGDIQQGRTRCLKHIPSAYENNFRFISYFLLPNINLSHRSATSAGSSQ